GVGEIGMNLALYGYGPPRDRSWLMVDCGVAFADESQPGVDLLMADIRFIEEERDSLLGIVLTHAHEDHYGAVGYLWPRLRVPVYATAFTAALMEAKQLSEPGAPKIPVKPARPGKPLSIGPFTVEYVPVAHSIPEAHSLVIRTDAGTALHTGDWKIDADPVVGAVTDAEKFRAIGRDGIDALICDSTNVLREGVSASEGEVAKVLDELIAKAPARVAVTTFSSNVARIRSVAVAAKKAKREVVVVGRAIARVVDVARELGLLDGIDPFRDEEAFAYLPRNKVVALCTGSQGEARAALARIASGDHPRVELASGDQVIFSSRTIPGNERAVNAVVNGLISQGIEVITDRDHLVHASGHPRRGEVEQMYDWVRPRAVVPVHGYPVHMASQAELARRFGIGEVVTIQNGEMVRLSPGPVEVIDEAFAGRLVKDGRIVLTPEESGVAERRRLSFAGIVMVSVALSRKGDIADDPQCELVGLPDVDENGIPFGTIVEDAAIGALESIPRPRRRDPDLVADALRRAVRAAVNRAWGKKPVCKVLVTVL
ncbi:MAG: ribonuclease J, partial [Hyphomicrobiales bacterium]|nr:ribonuclease J [Hyphomicrobiales bacterium]